MKNVIVFDLDGTLRDSAHRQHLVPKENLDRTESWAEFNLACGGDAPIRDNIALMDTLSYHFHIVVLTSCSAIAQALTLHWLRLSAECSEDIQLLMRPVDDHRTDVEFKEAKLREIGLDRILCCYDDNPRVVRHIRSLGVTCHAVRHYDNPGEHEK